MVILVPFVFYASCVSCCVYASSLTSEFQKHRIHNAKQQKFKVTFLSLPRDSSLSEDELRLTLLCFLGGGDGEGDGEGGGDTTGKSTDRPLLFSSDEVLKLLS